MPDAVMLAHCQRFPNKLCATRITGSFVILITRIAAAVTLVEKVRASSTTPSSRMGAKASIRGATMNGGKSKSAA